MLSVNCPSCGGTVIFDKDHIATYCPFCRSHLPDMTKYVQKAIDLDIEERMHKMDMELAEKELKKEKIKATANNIGNAANIIEIVIKGIVVAAFIGMIIYILTRISK